MKTTKMLGIFVLSIGIVSRASSALPLGWSESSMQGSASYNAGAWTITSPGDHFVYTSLSGNGQITAQIIEIDDYDCKASVIIKESLPDGVAYASMTISLIRGVGLNACFGYKVPGKPTVLNPDPGREIHDYLPHWIRLERRENTISGYTSANGDDWTYEASVDVLMSRETYIGMSVLNGTSQFNNVLVEPLGLEPSWEVSGDNMYYAGWGNIGIGTTNPLAKLHVRGGDILLHDSQYVAFMNSNGEINNTLTLFQETSGGFPPFNINTVEIANSLAGHIQFSTGQTAGLIQSRMTITNSGNVGIGTSNPQGKLDVNGSIYQRGTRLHADYVFESGYELESIDEHSQFMWEHGHLEAIPKAKVDDNGREIVEIGAHQRGIVEELEKAHIYIDQLNNRIKLLEEKLAKLETEQIPEQEHQ